MEPVAQWKVVLLSILVPGLGHHAVGASPRRVLSFAVPYVLLLWTMGWVSSAWPLLSVLILLALLGLTALALVDATRAATPGAPFHAPPAGVWWLVVGVVVGGIALHRLTPVPDAGAFVALAGSVLLTVGLTTGWTRWLAPGWILIGVAWPSIASMLPGIGPAWVLLRILGGVPCSYLAYRSWSVSESAEHTLRSTTTVALATVPLAAVLSSAGIRLWVDQAISRVSSSIAQSRFPGLRLVRDSEGTTAWDPAYYCHPNRPDLENGATNDEIGAYCASLPEGDRFQTTYIENEGLWTYTPGGELEMITPITMSGGFVILTYAALLGALVALGRGPRRRWILSTVLLGAGVVLREVVWMSFAVGQVSHWMAAQVLGPAVWLLGLATAAFLGFRRPGATEGVLDVLAGADKDSSRPDCTRSPADATPTTQHL